MSCSKPRGSFGLSIDLEKTRFLTQVTIFNSTFQAYSENNLCTETNNGFPFAAAVSVTVQSWAMHSLDIRETKFSSFVNDNVGALLVSSTFSFEINFLGLFL